MAAIDLPTFQRRMRRVRGIKFENLRYLGDEFAHGSGWYIKLLDENDKCYYKSTKHTRTANPSFAFSLAESQHGQGVRSKVLRLQLYTNDALDNYRVALSIQAHLSAFSRADIDSAEDENQCASLQIRFLFASTTSREEWMTLYLDESRYLTEPRELQVIDWYMTVNKSSLLSMYSSQNPAQRLLRLQKSASELATARKNKGATLDALEETMRKPSKEQLIMKRSSASARVDKLKIKAECLRARINELRCNKQAIEEQIEKKKASLSHRRDVLHEMKVKASLEGNGSSFDQLRDETDSEFFDAPDEYVPDENAELKSGIQQKQLALILELHRIYPITIKDGNYSIRGIPLCDNFLDYKPIVGNDNVESAGLGYLAHFVYLSAEYIQLPLRYPIHYTGSRSTLQDPFSEAHFGLYLSKSNKSAAEASHLMHRNVVQLAEHLGYEFKGANVLKSLRGLVLHCHGKLQRIVSGVVVSN